MTQGASAGDGSVDVSPDARAAAAALAATFASAAEDLDPVAEPAAFAPLLEGLADDREAP